MKTPWLAALCLVASCGKSGEATGKAGEAKPADGKPAKLSGTIKLDGSSTVFPISEAVAEEFGKLHGGVRVTVGISGTGGGFKKFCAGEIDIADASRPIKESEVEACAKAGIEFVELPIAYDGIAVVVNTKNDWVTGLTVAELKKMWEPEAQNSVMKWSDVNPAWPGKELRLYGAGVDSGTYDYFTEAITGKAKASRGDFTSSEDDNVLVTNVAGDVSGLAFFGYAYYVESKDKLKVLPVEGVIPTTETIANGTYKPLSRPIFIYVARKAFDRPEVAAFVDFYLEQGKALSAEVGYVALPEKAYQLAADRAEARKVGTVFKAGVSTVGMTIEQLLTQEAQ